MKLLTPIINPNETGLAPIPNPWNARPLPWAREQPLVWNLLAAVFVAFLWWIGKLVALLPATRLFEIWLVSGFVMKLKSPTEK